MDEETRVALERYVQTTEEDERRQRALLIRSTIVTEPIEEAHDNPTLIRHFGELKTMKAYRNKPASVELTDGLRVAFHPSRLGGPMKVYTFRGAVKVTRETSQPLKFVIVGRREDGHELWLTVTLINKRYTLTNVYAHNPNSGPRSSIHSEGYSASGTHRHKKKGHE